MPSPSRPPSHRYRPIHVNKNYSHRKMVSTAKALFLGIAVLLTASLILWPLVNPVEKHLKLTFTKVSTQKTGETQMENPQFQGIDDHNQPYHIYADRAVRQDNGTIKLTNITGDMTLKDDSSLSLSANEGDLALKRHLVHLYGEVVIISTRSYRFETERLTINLKKNQAHGNEPVTVTSPVGTLKASGFTLDNNTHLIDFSGPVTAIIQPE